MVASWLREGSGFDRNNPIDFRADEGLHGARRCGANIQMSDKQQSNDMSAVPIGEISHGPSAFEQFMDRNQTKLLILAIALVIASASYVIYKGVKQGGEEEAGALLVPAKDMADYQGIVQNHSGTAAAKSAKLLLADMQWEDGQEDDAIGTLRDLLVNEKDESTISTAKASLASKLRSQGKLDEAVGLFNELSSDPKALYLAPYALINMGDLAFAKNDLEGAKKAFEQVQRDFPKSQFAGAARERLMLLNAEKPKEVEPKVKLPDPNFSLQDGINNSGLNTGEPLIDLLNKQDGAKKPEEDGGKTPE